MHSMKQPETRNYDPAGLLDTVIRKLDLKNDAALSLVLEVAPPVISKIRHQKLGVGASLMIRIHDATGMSINDIRGFLGIPAK